MRFIVLMSLVAASMPIVMRRPLWGVAIYMGFNVIRPEMLFWGGKAASFVFIFYFGLTLLSTFIKGNFKKIKLCLHTVYMLMLWMMLAIYVSIALSIYPEVDNRQLYFAAELLKIFAFCILLYVNIDNLFDIKILEDVLLYCFSFMGVWGIEQQLRGNYRVEGLGGSAWGDSNGVAGMFVMVLPIALAKAHSSENRREFWIAICMVAIIVFLIVCTQSRGGLLGMLACIFSFGFFARKTLKVVKLAIIIAFIVIPIASESYFERMKTIQVSDTEDMEYSARSRLILWQAGLMVFADNPVFGTGFMTYPDAKMKYESNFLDLDDNFRSMVFRTENKKVAHSTYIQVLSECGLFGALPYVLILICVIMNGLKSRKLIKISIRKNELYYLSSICAGILGVSVCNLFMNNLVNSIFYWQVIISGILCMYLGESPPAKSEASKP